MVYRSFFVSVESFVGCAKIPAFDSQRNCRNPCAVPGGVGVSVVGLFLGDEAFPRLHYLDESAIASSVPFEQAVAGASGGSLVSSYRVNSFN